MGDMESLGGVFNLNTSYEQPEAETQQPCGSAADSAAGTRKGTCAPWPMGRVQAKRAGFKSFLCPAPCPKAGHGQERRVWDARCVQCIADAKAAHVKLVTREVERKLLREHGKLVHKLMDQARREERAKADELVREVKAKAAAELREAKEKAKRAGRAEATREANKAAQAAADAAAAATQGTANTAQGTDWAPPWD